MPIRHLFGLHMRVLALVLLTLLCLSASMLWNGRIAAAQEDVPPLAAYVRVEPPVSPQNATVVVSLKAFRAFEDVSVWQTAPDGEVRSLGVVSVDGDGNADLPLLIDAETQPGLYVVTGRGNRSERRATAELTVRAGGAPQLDEPVQLAVGTEETDEGLVVSLSGSGFSSSELIALWLSVPNQTVALLDPVRADGQGAFQVWLALDADAPVGSYLLTAQGVRSGLAGIVTFERVPEAADDAADDEAEQEEATLLIEPASAPSGSSVLIAGEGFADEEPITLWLTLESGAVDPLGEVTSDGDGTFTATLELGELPVGVHRISAYGNGSERLAIAVLEVLPAGGE
jgi:alpha-D-ribose 1-methylphosphonate 5-triphosphate synthase subunit PhnH